MKPNPDNKNILDGCLRWSHLLAFAGLAAAIVLYAKIEVRINAAEHKAELTQGLVEINQCNTLLREINAGDTNRASAYLKSRLASDIEIVNSLKSTDDAKGKEFAELVLHNIARDQKAHPGYYVASARLPKLRRDEVAQTTTRP